MGRPDPLLGHDVLFSGLLPLPAGRARAGGDVQLVAADDPGGDPLLSAPVRDLSAAFPLQLRRDRDRAGQPPVRPRRPALDNLPLGQIWATPIASMVSPTGPAGLFQSPLSRSRSPFATLYPIHASTSTTLHFRWSRPLAGPARRPGAWPWPLPHAWPGGWRSGPGWPPAQCRCRG